MITTVQLAAQCSCTDCPVNTISNATVTSTLNISGSTNNTLGSNGQELRSIYLDYDTDAINEVNVRLIAPNGSFVYLIEESGWNVGQNLNFKICFNNCGTSAIPDPGFSAFFDSSEDWQDNTDYGGTYYPTNANTTTEAGCLESLTGSVNGNWVLEIQDVVGLDDGVINDWFLVFADNSGTDCTNDFGCALAENCMADGGILDNTTVEACEGHPSLDVVMVPMYPNSTPPSTSDYGYTAVVYDENGVIIEYVNDPDFTSYSAGEYTFCGLSYLLDDLSLIPPADGSYSITDLQDDIDAAVFCGDLSDECNNIIIIAPLDPILVGPDEVCQGDLSYFTLTNILPNNIFSFSVNSGTFSFFEVNGNTLSVILESGPAEICVVASNACGSISDCKIVSILPPAPTILIDGPLTVCPNQDVLYEFSPSLQQGESYDINVENGILTGLVGNVASVNWNTPGSNMGELCVSIIGGACVGTESCIDVTILDISIPDQIFTESPLCNGQSSFATVMGNPDIINYIWELTNLTEISGNGSPTITYIAGNSGNATVCLTMESQCGLSEPICEDVFITAAPEPLIFLTSPVCNYSFSLATNANQNSDIDWFFLSGPSNPTFDNPSSQSTNIAVSAPGIYLFGVEVNDNGCIGTSTFSVEVFAPLVLESIEFDCNIQQEYAVNIEIMGGELPYQVNNSSISDSIFISEYIASGETYSFIIEDNQGCEIPIITGTYECSCVTDAGTMPSNLLIECAELGNSVETMSLLDTIMSEGDVGFYVLHDGAGPGLGNIIEFNTTGIFFYQSGIIGGETYYISYVLGQAQNGFVDMDNPCTSVSFGQAVIFYPKPFTEWNISDTICEGMFFLEFMNKENIDSISWEYLSGPVELDIQTVGDSVYFWAPEPNVYEYNLILYNDYCDTLIPFIFDIPISLALNNVTTECTLDPAYFTTSFEIEGSEIPFSCSVPGSFIGNVFTSEELSSTESHTIIVTDNQGCQVSLSVGPINCNCDIDIGTIDLDTIILCEGEFLDPYEISELDFMFDSDIYTYAFYTYNSPDDPLDQFIEFYYSGNIDQFPTYDPNEVYYLRLIISIQSDIPSEGLLLDDPCVTISDAVPFYWLQDYDFSFDIHPTVCVVEGLYSFDQNFDGPFPYVLTFINNDGVVVEFEIGESSETLSFPIYEGSVDWVLENFDGACGYTFGGNLNITGEPLIEFELNELDTLCNNSLFGSVLTLSDIISIPELMGVWTLNGNPVDNDFIDFDGFTEGEYELIFTSNGGSGSCPLLSDTTYIFIEECDCPSVIMMDQIVCGNEDNISLSQFTSTNLNGEFFIENVNNLAVPPVIIPDNNLSLTGVTPGIYLVHYELNDNWPQECQIDFIAEIEIEPYLIAGNSIETLEVCEGDAGTISLFELIEDYDIGGEWILDGNIISEVVDIETLDVGLYEYMYSFDIESSCEPNSTNVLIEVHENPELEILANDVLCFGDMNGTIMINILNEFIGPFTCTLDGSEVVEKEIEGLPPGYYTVQVVAESGCEVIVDSIEIGQPDVLQVELGADLVAFYDDQLTIEAIINLLTSDVAEVTWEDLDGIIDEDDLILIQNAIKDNTITITISDANGCIAMDEINIRLVELEVDLANIFIPDSENEENRRFGMPYIPNVTEVVEFRIYDRWGNNVFSAENVLPGSEQGYWYGDYNGQLAKQGVYAYFMRYNLASGEQKLLLGDVTLMK